MKVLGVDGSIHQNLHPYCDTENFLRGLLTKEKPPEYDVLKDLEQGIQVLAKLQLNMSYVASTKARTALSEQLGITISQVKEWIRYALRENIIWEQEYADPSLKIGKTKIYLLNLENPLVEETIKPLLEELKRHYLKMDFHNSEE